MLARLRPVFLVTLFELSLASVTLINAQTAGGIIQGIITDSQNAAIPNAEVTATNLETEVTVTTATNSSGLYEFPALNPGQYKITAKMQGFSSYTRSDIDLKMSQRLRVDIALVVGAVQQEIQVTGTPTVVDTDSAKVQHVIDGDVVQNLPFRGRNVYMFTRLVPGANTTAAADLFANPFDTFAPSNISFNGAPVQANSITVNGVANQFGSGALGFAPSVEGVQEVSVQSFALSAEYGQTAGTVVQIETKSGTNDWHGSLYEYYNGNALNANNFFSNRAGAKKPPQIINQFGGTIGGPVIVPKLYNGKNKTFFFFNYEGIRELFGYASTSTVPSAQQRTGDFSQTFGANGQLITIYDPNTTAFDASGALVRTAFPGNRIPAERISPVGQNVLQYVPLPNQPGLTNNYIYTGGYTENSNSYQPRIDHQFSDRNVLYFTYGGIRREEFFLSSLPTGVTGWIYPTDSKLWTLNDSHIFSPTTILNVRFGVSWTQQSVAPHAGVEERNALGFSSAFLSSLHGQGFPTFSFPDGDMSGFGQGYQSWSFYRPNLRVGVTKIQGRHSLQFGYEFANYRANTKNQYGEDGSFTFSRELTRGPNASVSSANAGHDAATLLLGAPTGGSVAINAHGSAQTLYNALYVQDNWRISSSLTLNLGLRWDYETPPTERYDRMTAGFDTTIKSPIADAAIANYNMNPIPEVSDFRVNGGLLFAGGSGSRYNMNPKRNNFMPRLGVSWQPFQKTVLRAGWGMFYLPLMEISGNGVGQSNLPFRQDGFAATTQLDAPQQGRPVVSLVNPFPNGIIQPTGSSLGASTLLGQSINAYDIVGRRGITQEFQFSIQRELPWQTLLDIAYVGSRTDKLPVNAPINAVPQQYNSLGDELNRQVPNPFLGLIQVGTLSRPTVAKSQLLRPYPEFQNTTIQFQPIGQMWYNSLQVSANKRFSAGFSFLASYTWGKHMEERGFLNAYQPLETVISPIDRTHRFVLSGEWQLPFGKARAHGRNWPGVLQYVLGDWDLTYYLTLTTGQPITGFGGASTIHEPEDIDQSISKWFDTSAFIPQPPFTNRTLSTNLSWLRLDGTRSLDLTIGKNFPIYEQMFFRLQGMFYNVTNTPQFGSPNTSVTNAAFGSISSQTNQPRWVQVSGKFVF